MLVSGLVLCLNDDASGTALEAIRCRPGLELGPVEDPRRVPAVLEAPTEDASRKAIEGLEAHEGVHHVEVAFIGFDRSQESSDAARSA